MSRTGCIYLLTWVACPPTSATASAGSGEAFASLSSSRIWMMPLRSGLCGPPLPSPFSSPSTTSLTSYLTAAHPGPAVLWGAAHAPTLSGAAIGATMTGPGIGAVARAGEANGTGAKASAVSPSLARAGPRCRARRRHLRQLPNPRPPRCMKRVTMSQLRTGRLSSC